MFNSMLVKAVCVGLVSTFCIWTSQSARAQTYQLTYTGKAFKVPKGGAAVPGVTNLQLVYLLPTLPAPGQCVERSITTPPDSYTDGSNTIASLEAEGFGPPDSYFYFCMDAKGNKIASWSFQFDAQYHMSQYFYDLYQTETNYKPNGMPEQDFVLWNDYPYGPYERDVSNVGKWKITVID